MIYALNRSFDIVRTVLSNKVNDIYVCKDADEQIGSFYTMITIKDDTMKKKFVALFTNEADIRTNNDYIGCFVLENCFNILFIYREERKLHSYLDVYSIPFDERKVICTQLVSSTVAAKLPAYMLCALLKPSNININKNKTIYFNYFIDFTVLSEEEEKNSYTYLGEVVFNILAKEYEHVYNINRYPKELRLFYKKLRTDGFNSFSQIYKYLNLLPEKLIDDKGLWYRIKSFWWQTREQVKTYSFLFVIGIVIAITLLYTMTELGKRFEAAEVMKQMQLENSNSYDGMYEIGTVKVHTIKTSEE
jgi:hypothetical protein